ncbi:MAG: transglycosylase SLT domain-containing protein [Anaerolineales bacterium]
MNRSRGSRLLAILLGALLIAGAIALWASRDSLRSPSSLYAEAQQADGDRGRRLYSRLSRKRPELGEYAELWQAEASMPSVEGFRDLQTLAQYRPSSPIAYLANLAIARYYADLDEAEAESAYLAALEQNDTVELRLELARFYEERGEAEEAYAHYHRLLPNKPDAFQGMRRNASDPVQLAEDLNAATYFSDALEVLREVNDPLAARLRGWAHFGLGDYESAIDEIQEWLRIEPQSAEDELRLAQALGRLGQIDQALSIYRRLDTPDSKLALAQLLESRDTQTAVDLYLELPYPVAWWNATWILEGEDRIEEVLPVYTRIAESGAYFGDDAAYRLTVLGARYNNPTAEARGRQLLQGYGLSWLSQLAGSLPEQLPASPAVDPGADDILARVHALDDISRPDLADLELLFCGRHRRQLNVRVACMQELVSRGKHLDAQAIADEYIQEQKKPSISLWQMAYPQPYAEIVDSAAEEFGVDPLLIWAVMRAESRYDPHATSAASARGLMQIIPTTQDWIAEHIGLQLAPGDAYVPEINVKLGTWYLSYLLDQFDGDLELALAAYNGGELNVRDWLEDPMVGDRHDLIRWIGFGETREYLGRVLINLWVYREIYS